MGKSRKVSLRRENALARQENALARQEKTGCAGGALSYLKGKDDGM